MALAPQTPKEKACFETTRRLLAALINEGLVDAFIEGTTSRCMRLQRNRSSAQNDSVIVHVTPGASIEDRNGEVLPVIEPSMLRPPVTVRGTEMQDPGEIFSALSPWFEGLASKSVLENIAQNLHDSGVNQEIWLGLGPVRALTLHDSSTDWERTLIYGHPTHPFHRTCAAKPPLPPVKPDDIPGMLTPDLTFLSVPNENLRIAGPYASTLQPLLQALRIPSAPREETIIPALTQQLPSITHHFPRSRILKTIPGLAHAQASMRTLTLRPELNFPYHLKLSLACQITSALRTITPWSALGGPIITNIMQRFLPGDLWVFGEVASATGSQSDFNDARHLSCILREDLEGRAKANNEALILASALTQSPPGTKGTCYAEMLFGLETTDQKVDWLRAYVQTLFSLILPPLISHSIALEGHGQNILIRICRFTKKIKGFAVRDFGGIRLHVPTLEAQGVGSLLEGMPRGWAVMTDDIHEAWGKVHHSLIQNHVGFLVSGLGLREQGEGWGVVRGVLGDVCREVEGKGRGKTEEGEEGFYNFCMKDTMPFKCFLRMSMEGKYRDYVEREVPNTLLKGTERWEGILDKYEPVLHWT